MTKSELVTRLVKANPHLIKRDVEMIVSIFFGEITAALARGDRAEIRGFGTFSIKRRNARSGRNPRTGASVSVPEKCPPVFRGSRLMVKRLNSSA
jgi:integration host factor subunit beta